jgi:hypothetical protein
VDYRDLKLGLEVLTEGEGGHIPRRFHQAAEQEFRANRVWTADPHIQGFGIGRKIVRGRVERDLTIKVYVDRKVPADQLDHPAPTAVAMKPFFRKEVPVDVQAIGQIRLEWSPIRSYSRPVIIGSSGAHQGVQAGTIGLLVQQLADPQHSYLLSACHTFALSGMANVGEAILQPSIVDGGNPPADQVAELSSWVVPQFTPFGYPNVADAAIARVTHPQPILPDIHLIDAPQGVAGVRLGTGVQKTGRTTGYTLGMVIDTDFKYDVTWPNPAGGFGRVGFRDQVLCTRYAAPGDSGSALLNRRRNRVVGIHVGGSEFSRFFLQDQECVCCAELRPALTVR